MAATFFSLLLPGVSVAPYREAAPEAKVTVGTTSDMLRGKSRDVDLWLCRGGVWIVMMTQ